MLVHAEGLHSGPPGRVGRAGLGFDLDRVPAGVPVNAEMTGQCRDGVAGRTPVRAAAPEISSIEVVAPAELSDAGVIPAESLMTRMYANGSRGREEQNRTRATAWQPVPELAELSDGEVGGFRVSGATALVCRVGCDVFAYRDQCPSCLGTLAGAQLSGAVLRCPGCGAGFDVVHAGAGVGGDSHLDPIPVLVHDGVLSMAVPQEVA